MFIVLDNILIDIRFGKTSQRLIGTISVDDYLFTTIMTVGISPENHRSILYDT